MKNELDDSEIIHTIFNAPSQSCHCLMATITKQTQLLQQEEKKTPITTAIKHNKNGGLTKKTDPVR